MRAWVQIDQTSREHRNLFFEWEKQINKKYVTREKKRNFCGLSKFNILGIEVKKCDTLIRSLDVWTKRSFLIIQQIRLMCVGMMMIQKTTESITTKKKKKNQNQEISRSRCRWFSLLKKLSNTCELLMHIINKVTEW